MVSRDGHVREGEISGDAQVVLVLGDFPIAQDVFGEGLAVVGEVEDVQHVVFLLLHHLPAEVHD